MTQELDKLENALKTDLEKLRKTNRKRKITFIVLGLFMISYMSWMKSQISALLNEDELAAQVVNEAINYLPEGQKALAGFFLEQAPSLVNYTADAAEGMLPEGRHYVETQLDERMALLFDKHQGVVEDIFDNELDEHEDEIKVFIRELEIDGSNSSDTSLAVLEKEFKAVYHQAVAVERQQFQSQFNRLDEELANLLRSDPKDLSQTLRYRRELLLCSIAYVRNITGKKGDDSEKPSQYGDYINLMLFAMR